MFIHLPDLRMFTRCSLICFFAFRPGFLPDPNDGSLYVLGDKHKQGLMVSILTVLCVCVCVICVCVMRDFSFLCRNFPSLFQSWFSHLPVEAQMASCTQVNTWKHLSHNPSARKGPADLHTVYMGALGVNIRKHCYYLSLNIAPTILFPLSLSF